MLQQDGLDYNVASGDLILVFSPPQTKPHNTNFATECDSVTVTIDVTSLRQRLMAVFWGAGRDGDTRQEGLVGRWGEARNAIALHS